MKEPKPSGRHLAQVGGAHDGAEECLPAQAARILPPLPSRQRRERLPRLQDLDQDGKATWRRRQDALDAGRTTDALEPHEIRFYEEFQRAGRDVRLIERPAPVQQPWGAWERPSSNDFVWLDAGVQAEAKSFDAPDAKHIKRTISKAVRTATRWGVTKAVFVIYSRERPFATNILRQLSDYNRGHGDAKIHELFVWDGQTLFQVPLA